VADQDKERLDDRVEKREKLDEPDVEAHKLESRAEAGRAEAGRNELGETDEPDVEAHRFDKFEGRAEA
jgi:hypothetical protein